ncbi:hypothetical protein LTR84_007127 [Exophiala bonariae]|uniref:Enoyl reductase (ER) domain-containing protein n=1 Tax=Exophiala bonariae TaxID=1690606 RepID=A0AAV9N1J4_9EURO|nr:hypothetical protein LTR84_007127 [Exophiala bonariae]
MNPTDYKHIDNWNNRGCLVGCDYSGVVEELGSGYSKPWKVGDRICGFAHGGNELNHEDGAFAVSIVVKADIAIRLPDSMSHEEGCTLPVAVITCGQALFMDTELPRPLPDGVMASTGRYILIYGGSSATGSIAIQFAKLVGLVPITICSARNFEFVSSLGAVAAFDYNNPEACVAHIQEFMDSRGGIEYVFDTISTAKSAEICGKLIETGGVWAYTLLGTDIPREDVKKIYPLAYLSTGERIKKGDHVDFAASRANFDFVQEWALLVESLLQKSLLRPHPSYIEHGLEKVLDGLELMRGGKVSGKKLVYML